MSTPKTSNPGTGDKAAERKHQEDVLDESLEETFPASDPPAITEPKRKPGPHGAD